MTHKQNQTWLATIQTKEVHFVVEKGGHVDLNSVQQADHLSVTQKTGCHDSRLYFVNLWVVENIQTIKFEFVPGFIRDSWTNPERLILRAKTSLTVNMQADRRSIGGIIPGSNTHRKRDEHSTSGNRAPETGEIRLNTECLWCGEEKNSCRFLCNKFPFVYLSFLSPYRWFSAAEMFILFILLKNWIACLKHEKFSTYSFN